MVFRGIAHAGVQKFVLIIKAFHRGAEAVLRQVLACGFQRPHQHVGGGIAQHGKAGGGLAVLRRVIGHELRRHRIVLAGLQVHPAGSRIKPVGHTPGHRRHGFEEPGRGGKEFHIRPAQLLGGADHGDSGAHAQRHRDDLAAIGLELLHRADEILLVGLVGGFRYEGHARIGGAFLGRGRDFDAEIGGQIHGAGLGQPIFLGQIGQTRRRLVIVA
jgi:hypothetical protein